MIESETGWLDDLKVEKPDREIYKAVKSFWDTAAKPLDGLGRFEDLHSRIGAIQHTVRPDIGSSAVLVFCADNGIVQEGVSQSGQEVTRACAVNLGKQQTSVCVMAKETGVRVIPVDIGIAFPGTNQETCHKAYDDSTQMNKVYDDGAQTGRETCHELRHVRFPLGKGDTTSETDQEQPFRTTPALYHDSIPGVLNCKIAAGTRDFLKEPAMTREETLDAIRVGMELVRREQEEGIHILGIGELGIGNTTTSACVAASLLGCDPELVTGRGAGLSDAGLQHKREVVGQALVKWGLSWKSGELETWSGPDHAFCTLSTVGGLDIAGMAGACIGGAVYHVPIVLDGVISMTAALVAERLVPGVRDYLIPSHTSREPAARMIEKELLLAPVLDANMALGEGTGAVMMLSLLKLADCVYADCVRFDNAGVEAYHRF